MNESEGKKRFSEVEARGIYYQPIIKSIFSLQITSAGCGIQSCALCLSAYYLALTVFAPVKDCLALISSSRLTRLQPPWTERNFYDLEATKKSGITKEKIAHRGMTLDEVGHLLRFHGFMTVVVHVDNSTPEQFRKDLIHALSCDSKSGIILNFKRRVLSTTMHPTSHHSPAIAYHQSSDCLLVLDTGYTLDQHFW